MHKMDMFRSVLQQALRSPSGAVVHLTWISAEAHARLPEPVRVATQHQLVVISADITHFFATVSPTALSASKERLERMQKLVAVRREALIGRQRDDDEFKKLGTASLSKPTTTD